MRVGDRLGEDRPAAAQRIEDVFAEQREGNGEEDARDRSDRYGVEGQRCRARHVARAECAADGRRDAATHGAGREHLHQHHHRKHERDGGEFDGAEDADVGRLADRDERRHRHGHQVRYGEAQQRRQDGRGDERVRRQAPRLFPGLAVCAAGARRHAGHCLCHRSSSQPLRLAVRRSPRCFVLGAKARPSAITGKVT